MDKIHLEKVIYLGTVAPMERCQPGDIHAVAVTQERNAWIVWYAHALAHRGTVSSRTSWKPAEGGIFWNESGGTSPRDQAIERAVTDALKLHKKAQGR